MKKYFFTILVVTGLFLASCSNELDDVQIIIPESQENQLGIGQTDGILSFDSEATFREAIEKVRNNESLFSVLTRSTGDDFSSLFAEYDQAMEEADLYYQREGGYEEFKQKFPNLYYPEYEDDYAAFLPVSDEAIAKLVNPEGKVIINGEEKDMRDVFSYEKLRELGLAMPIDEVFNPTTRSSGRYPGRLKASVRYDEILTISKRKINSKRRMWVTIRGIVNSEYPHFPFKQARIDVCWRKKGAVAWYNGKLHGHPTIVDILGEEYQLDKKYEYSPMKFTVISIPNGLVWRFPQYSPLDLYVRFESDQTRYDFTACYQANLKDILDLNNGDGWFEKFSPAFRDALLKIAGHYGNEFINN